MFTRDFISGEKNNIFNSVYGQSLIAAYLKYTEMKLIALILTEMEIVYSNEILQNESTHTNFS